MAAEPVAVLEYAPARTLYSARQLHQNTLLPKANFNHWPYAPCLRLFYCSNMLQAHLHGTVAPALLHRNMITPSQLAMPELAARTRTSRQNCKPQRRLEEQPFCGLLQAITHKR
ncbi:hypothetical protein ABE493_01545 [Stenotrophomonas terrae]|uniref:hypothetical protein n=1 Tax=Stenotrophomonas terrae TaxID=405446 RepID=UPI00320A974E